MTKITSVAVKQEIQQIEDKERNETMDSSKNEEKKFYAQLYEKIACSDTFPESELKHLTNGSHWDAIDTQFRKKRFGIVYESFEEKYPKATNQELAIRVGASPKTVNRWRNGKLIKDGYFGDIQAELGVSKEFFDADAVACEEIRREGSFETAVRYSKRYHQFLHYCGMLQCHTYEIELDFVHLVHSNSVLRKTFLDAVPYGCFEYGQNPASKFMAKSESYFQFELEDGRMWYAIDHTAMEVLKKVQDEIISDIQKEFQHLRSIKEDEEREMTLQLLKEMKENGIT